MTRSAILTENCLHFMIFRSNFHQFWQHLTLFGLILLKLCHNLKQICVQLIKLQPNVVGRGVTIEFRAIVVEFGPISIGNKIKRKRMPDPAFVV